MFRALRPACAAVILALSGPRVFLFGESAPSCSPESQALTAKAALCYDHGDMSCAKSGLSQALANQPDCAQALYLESFLSERDGRAEEARLLRDKALRLDPHLRQTAEKRTDHPIENVSFDEDHDIFNQEPFHALLALARQAVPASYAAITAQWNLHYPGLLHPLTVQVKEIKSDTLVRWKVAYVQPSGLGSQLQQLLVLDIGNYVQNPRVNYNMVIMHEMAHVIIGDVEAGSEALPIPPWVNEGFAQSVTTEGRWRVQEEIVEIKRTGEPALECDIDGPVDEFAHGPFNAKCYSEFYLSVQYLRRQGGPATLTKILSGLHQGTPMTELIHTLTGKDWPSFKNDAAHYVRDVLAGSVPIP
jgi:hypothetical protein